MHILLFVGVAVICGVRCATHRPVNDSPASWHSSGFHPAIAREPFDIHVAAFTYIAEREGLPSDSRTLVALAADSTLERCYWPLTGDLVIFRA